MSSKEHVARVRVLYKSLLRLHRGLPSELKVIGDQYVKDEFRRHKNAEPQFVPVFMNEWTNYAINLATQLGRRSQDGRLGAELHKEQLDSLSDEQISQLHELMVESQKPRDPDNPLGENPLLDDLQKTS